MHVEIDAYRIRFLLCDSSGEPINFPSEDLLNDLYENMSTADSFVCETDLACITMEFVYRPTEETIYMVCQKMQKILDKYS